MKIDYDKLAAAILRQQQQQPSVAREVALKGEGRGVKIWASGIDYWGGVIFGYTHFRGGVHFSSTLVG